jgi:hypothetical protein
MAEMKFGWRRENLSAAPNTPSDDTPDDNSKPAPAAEQRENTPAEVAPAPKA